MRTCQPVNRDQLLISPVKPDARAIGLLMCGITENLLWPSAGKPGAGLRCRVGSGQATYHRFDPHQKQHLITYGVRMIQAKQQAESARGWLSTREILRRGYFDGEPSPLNLLAHTCCHEFAHLLQCQAGQRYRGSVHNRQFYAILDDLYLDGRAQATRRALEQQARNLDLELADTPLALPPAEPIQSNWQPGQEVSFPTRRGLVQGRILRVNRNTCTVDGAGRFQGIRYRVPLQLLQPAR